MDQRQRGTKSIKDRDVLYRLIVSQLRYDGYETAASSLAHTVASFPPPSPSSRLAHLVQLGVQTEGDGAASTEIGDLLPHIKSQGAIDLEYESDAPVSSPSLSKYQMNYAASFKGPCLTTAFSRDSKLVACGSADLSIKVMDVEMMVSRSGQGHNDVHPVIRTLYDHIDAVTTLDFHPTVSVLASGSKDCTIRLFDYSKPSVKRAYRVIQEVAPIRCIYFHPSGDFMVVGTQQSTLRLYDITTLQCFVSSDARDQHSGPVTSLDYSLDGKLYTTSSKDGCIKVWDGVSNRCVSTFHAAHSGQMVSSVKFSKNGKYILSSGKDGCGVLWELTSARPLNTYQPSNTKLLPYRPCAVFNHTEDYVLMQEEKMLLSWNSRTSQLLAPVVSGHVSTVLWLAHSPTSPAFVTCGSDCKMRFFCYKEQ